MTPDTPSADQILTTTRAVRRRLDLERDVDRSLIEECVEIAQQAPTGSNTQGWHFLVVTEPILRAELGAIYREAWDLYAPSSLSALNVYHGDDPRRQEAQRRVVDSGRYLAEHLAQVPVHVIPCIEGRADGQPSVLQSVLWGSIIPAAWSFMLAARRRGLGTSYTTLHLLFEDRAAHALDIPFDRITQAALIPVAHANATAFKTAPREPASSVIHWERW